MISAILLISLLASSCGNLFVNGETSEIGSIDPYTYCLEKNTWDTLQQFYSINEVKDSSFNSAITKMKNHWISPDYILYFKDNPEEIIACEYYEIRLLYNPKLSSEILDGLDVTLSDSEQVRVRNRVLSLLSNYACDKGKITIKNNMNEPAIFSEEYYDKQKKWYNIFD